MLTRSWKLRFFLVLPTLEGPQGQMDSLVIALLRACVSPSGSYLRPRQVNIVESGSWRSRCLAFGVCVDQLVEIRTCTSECVPFGYPKGLAPARAQRFKFLSREISICILDKGTLP